MHSDVSAVRLLLESTEGARPGFGLFNDDGDSEGENASVMEIVFIESNGDGRVAPGQLIDAAPRTLAPTATD